MTTTEAHAAPTVEAEAQRLAALISYNILDTIPEQGFDDIVLLATQICETPVALVSLVTSERQWFKARIGFDPCETPLSQSVCAHALWRPGLLIIPDLTLDPRTRNNTLVTEDPHIRFYAGARLETPRGEVLGTLCVIDGKPRPEGLTAGQTIALEALARQVMTQLELRRTAAERQRAEEQLRELAASLEQRVEERTQALAHSEARLQAYFDASPEYLSVLRVTKNGDLVYDDLNAACARLFGLTRAEVIGRSPAEVLSPESTDSVETQARACLAAGKAVHYEVQRTFKSPGLITANVVATPIDGPNQGETLILFCGRDMTEQRTTEDALRQSQKMEAVGQLTGGLAHDFNNLLAVISGSLELLASRVSQGRINDIDRFVNAAQTATQRAASLTHRLLAFSRRQTLDPRLTEINQIVTGMKELIDRTAGPAIGVEIVLAQDLWKTRVDPNQLENALLNLCINAKDAMPDGGKMTVETSNRDLSHAISATRDMPAGDYVALSVSDTGCGMTPEVIARAFEPFYTTKPTGHGTGLGLSMIYGFAHQSDGQVRIHSEVGRGSNVTIFLPRADGDAEEDSDRLKLEKPGSAERGQTVLVVDDEANIRMLITEVLMELGYNAIEAHDGPSALKVLQSDLRIDLLVTDVGMPGGMNGRQLSDAGRIVRPDLKVLFITGYAETAAFTHDHIEPGMAVIVKPFSMDVLANRIKEMISAK